MRLEQPTWQANTSRCSSILIAFSILMSFSSASMAETEPESTAGTVHIAFAGGGWRAHSGHSAWTLSLLETTEHSLDKAFKNVGSVSSNSGGSWFSSMLFYSPSFVESIENAKALETWTISGENATGWLGQQQTHFDNAPCHEAKGALFSLCVAAYYSGGPIEATYWHKVAEEVVFRDHQIPQLLSGERLAWAKNKPLLMASTLLISQAVIGRVGLDEQYYQGCFAPQAPSLLGSRGAYCTKGSDVDVTSVTFSSMPKNSTWIAPPFLPEVEVATLNLGYSEHEWSRPAISTTKLTNAFIPNDHTPVMTAASASSAAAGFAASKSVTDSWPESYIASDQALNFRLDGKLEHVLANGIGARELAKQQIVQIADGGAMDNSAVAQLVSFLQRNEKDNEFSIVAFDNVQSLYQQKVEGGFVGPDFANLFGEGLANGNQICSGPNGTGNCVKVPDLQIFEVEALHSTPVTWRHSNTDDGNGEIKELLYTKFRVKTVENKHLAVAAGTEGTLHAFTAAWSAAATIPQNDSDDGDFIAYDNMVEFIHSGLQAEDGGRTGISYLRSALGL